MFESSPTDGLNVNARAWGGPASATSSSGASHHQRQDSGSTQQFGRDGRPMCKFFAHGGCTRTDCPYSHDLTVEAPAGVDASAGFILTGNIANAQNASSPTPASRHHHSMSGDGWSSGGGGGGYASGAGGMSRWELQQQQMMFQQEQQHHHHHRGGGGRGMDHDAEYSDHRDSGSNGPHTLDEVGYGNRDRPMTFTAYPNPNKGGGGGGAPGAGERPRSHSGNGHSHGSHHGGGHGHHGHHHGHQGHGHHQGPRDYDGYSEDSEAMRGLGGLRGGYGSGQEGGGGMFDGLEDDPMYMMGGGGGGSVGGHDRESLGKLTPPADHLHPYVERQQFGVFASGGGAAREFGDHESTSSNQSNSHSKPRMMPVAIDDEVGQGSTLGSSAPEESLDGKLDLEKGGKNSGRRQPMHAPMPL